MHLPRRRDSVFNVDHLIHSEGFWAFVVLTMILLTLVLIGWWSNVNSIVPLPDFYFDYF